MDVAVAKKWLQGPLVARRVAAVVFRLVAALVVEPFVDWLLEVEPMRLAFVLRLKAKGTEVPVTRLVSLLLLPQLVLVAMLV